MAYEFRLPDIGEGLTEGEIVKWLVKEGDLVRENQPLVNVLTDKAEVEIPSPKSGTILRLLAKEGQKVPVHSAILTIQEAGEPARAAAATPGGRPAQALATPAVRKLASDLGVDLSGVAGTGPGGRITDDDVRRASGGGKTEPAVRTGRVEVPQILRGSEERVPYKGIRRRTGEKMALSKRAIPHVTHFEEADVTALISLREELLGEATARGAKLSFTPFFLKALAGALKEFPYLNASLDESSEEIVLKRYYNIGIAVSAGQGLYVPVIKDVDKKDVFSLAKEVADLSARARENKLNLSELQGGTFTLTNIGPVGGLFATPIINAPEVAILGVMKIQERPVVRNLEIVSRSMLNLALSFDHRVVDGAEAASFVNTLVKFLENPRTAL